MPEARRPPGRPRSETARQAILRAALELVTEVGYAQATVDGIAGRAGVGKQTIYRWWPGKADVLFEALRATAELHAPITDHGSYAADLRGFLDATYALGRDGQLTELLRQLMGEAQVNPEFGARFRSGFLQRRRDALAVLTDRARERGDLPATPDPGTVADIVFGTVWYRILATGEPLDDRLAGDLVAVLTTGDPLAGG